MPQSPAMSALCREIREDLATLPAVQRIYEDVPDSINEYPAVVVAPASWSCWLATHASENGKSQMMCKVVIHVEVHVPRKDLPEDVDRLVKACDSLPGWLYAGFVRDKWGHTVVTTGDPRTAQNATVPLSGEIQEGSWGDQQTLAWVTNIEITTEQEIET